MFKILCHLPDLSTCVIIILPWRKFIVILTNQSYKPQVSEQSSLIQQNVILKDKDQDIEVKLYPYTSVYIYRNVMIKFITVNN